MLDVEAGVLFSSSKAAPLVFVVGLVLLATVFWGFDRAPLISRAAGLMSIALLLWFMVALVLGVRRQRSLLRLAGLHGGLICTECGHPHDRDEDVVRCPECGAELSVAKARAAWEAAIKGANFQTPPPPR